MLKRIAAVRRVSRLVAKRKFSTLILPRFTSNYCHWTLLASSIFRQANQEFFL
jgi:hypothetical protein